MSEATVSLPDDLPQCHAMIRELVETVGQSQRQIDQLEHRLGELLRRMYGRRSEQTDPAQQVLFPDPEPEPVAAGNTEELPDTQARPRRSGGHGRQRLPEDLPRRRVEHDLSDAEKACPTCGELRCCIGEEISEQLDYEPASAFVVEHARKKYACRHCQEHVDTAAKPPQPIDRGLPGPGLLAHVVISKYADHLPLHRQEGILARFGIELSRSTLCDWMAACARLLHPLYFWMKAQVLLSRVIWTDDTPVPVLDRNQDRTRLGRLWVYLGDNDHPFTLFDYTPNRKRDGPAQFLSGYRGHLQADAFGGYDGIYANGVTEVGCWAHARRKFFECRTTDALRAHEALARIGQLYAIERRGKELGDDERAALRQAEAAPLLRDFEQWLRHPNGEVLPKSPFGAAVTYALNQWQALTRYTTAGYLSIDNNASERALRAIAVGRNNWQFCGSDRGGDTAAVLFSVMATCRRHDVEVFTYLRDVLRRLPTHPIERVNELAPDRWTPANDEV